MSESAAMTFSVASPVATGLLLALTPALPLVLAGAWTWRPWRAPVARLLPWAGLPALLTSVLAAPGAQLDLSWLLLDCRLWLDRPGAAFLLSASLVWMLSGAYARTLASSPGRGSRLAAFYLLAMAGNLGLIIAHDMITFYSMFALMSLSSYGLIVHSGEPAARRAGRIYIALMILAEVMVLTGALVAASHSGTTDLPWTPEGPASAVVLLLLFFGFGIKAGVPPLHFSLPLAYAAAPAPAAAVLGGAMLNAGILGWLRFLPTGQSSGSGLTIVAAGLVAILFGIAVGALQRLPRAVLAYSSISQVGLLALAMGAGMMSRDLWPAATAAVVLYACHHGLVKAALLYGSGMAEAEPGSRLGRGVVTLGLALAALSLAGVPPSGGWLAKAVVKPLAEGLPAGWSGAAEWSMVIGVAGTTLLMVRFVALSWARPSTVRAPAGVWLAWVGLVALALLAAFGFHAAGETPGLAVSPGAVWSGLWPLSLGLVAGVLLQTVRPLSGLNIPPGDVLWTLLALWRKGRGATRRWLLRLGRLAMRLAETLLAPTRKLYAAVTRVRPSPDAEPRWATAAILFSLLVLVLVAALGAR